MDITTGAEELPKFPEFKKVEWGDKEKVENYTSRFLPYSDFNFISLWSWDTENEREISLLNGNLVVKFTDYTDGKPFYSFIGTKQVNQTIETLLKYSIKVGIPPILRLVPEEVIVEVSDKYLIKEDNNNFDYIYSTEQLMLLEGNRFKNKRQMAAKFAKCQPGAKVISKDISNEDTQIKLFDLLHTWKKNKENHEKDYEILHEQSAIIHLLRAIKKEHQIFLTLITLNENILAFSIDEQINREYAISHFFKVDVNYSGISEYFNQHISRVLHESGVKYWNWEQDLGIESLKINKSRYRPCEYLKKYTIEADKLV